MHTKRRRWRRHFDRVRYEQIEPLRYQLAIFRLFQVHTRVREGTPAHDISDWIATNYISSVLTGIRRTAEPIPTSEKDVKRKGRTPKIRRQSVSLVRLLEELRDTPDAITYVRFQRVFRGSGVSRKLIHEQWARNGGGTERVGKREIGRDLARLRQATTPLRAVTNKVVAHTAVVTRKRADSWFQRSAEAIDLLVELHRKYDFLLFGRVIQPVDYAKHSDQIGRGFRAMWEVTK